MKTPIDDTKLRQTAVTFPYPKTPNMAPAVWVRIQKEATTPFVQWRFAIASLIIILLFLAVVPPVRAGLVNFFRLGSINVFLGETSESIISSPIPLPELPGQMTFADAQSLVTFPINFPPELGEPDAVYYSEDWSGLVTLVWQEQGILLQILEFNIIGSKIQLDFAEEVTVNSFPALWIEEPHLLTLYDERVGFIDVITRQVNGHVLIWAQDCLTYRIETSLSKSEVITIAETITKK